MERALRNRLTFGPIMLAGLFLLLWVDHRAQSWTVGAYEYRGEKRGLAGLGVVALLLIAMPGAVAELANLFAAERVRPYRVIAAAGSAALIFHAFATQFPQFQPIAASSLAFIIVFVMLMAALRRALDRQSQDAIVHMAGTVLATLYLGGLAWFLVALRVKGSPRVRGSTVLVLMILLCVKFTDIGAFFGGRAFGKRKLIPWLSPGKTWEGLFFGLLTAAGVGAICAVFIDARRGYELPWWKGAIFGAVIGGVGQLGDLLESMMKRDAEVKDSGTSLPGFGGILDVTDSPLLAAPFAYLLFSLPW
jgi:phosphatidate cytidylyltransferase